MPSSSGWTAVWARRQIDPSRGSRLAQLLAADGYETTLATLDELQWSQWVRRWANRVGITSRSSIFEVGCGAGAFLLPLVELGCEVGGIDQSAALIQIARNFLPAGEFDVADAADLDPDDQADYVVAMGTFLYFDDLDYADRVLQLMAAKSRRGLLVFDVPDAATREEAIAYRIQLAGGVDAYNERYAHLDHLYYERQWMETAICACGFTDVNVTQQDLPGHPYSQFRFNAWALRSNT